MSAPREKSRRASIKGPLDARLLEGDCLEILQDLDAESVDAVVCDPPYGIGFKGEAWDAKEIREAAAQAGHERLTPNEAFEIWCGMWGKECARVMKPGAFLVAFGATRTFHRLTSGIEDAGLEIRDTLMWLYGTGMVKSRRFPHGRSTSLRPFYEPILLARRATEGTIRQTMAKHGTGTLEAGRCRVGGRHPANAIGSHGPDCKKDECAASCAARTIDESCGRGSRPSRLLYCPKITRAERNAGCEELPQRDLSVFPSRPPRWPTTGNPHPTVKPLELMRWTIRLACPAGGLVLDPFCGSGSTGAASMLEGRRFLGIERDSSYLRIAAARIAYWSPRGTRKPTVRRLPRRRRR